MKQPGSIDDNPKNISYGVFSSDPHLNDENIVYSIEWTPDHVYYSATASDGTIIQDWTYSNPKGIPSINSTVCMCLLPLAGRYYPESGNAAEVVLKNFTYTPYECLVEKPTTTNGVDPSTSDTSGSEQTIQKPVVSFYGSRTSGTAPMTVKFTDASEGSPTAWIWSFGDGTYSTDQNPRHTYSKAGTYSVTLKASNAAGSVTKTRCNYIKVKSGR